jgi:hypothetical protein
MTIYNCGHCLFAEETADRSSDEIDCFFKEMGRRKINDYPCGRWREGKGVIKNERTGIRQD